MAALQSLRQDVGKGHTHSQAKLDLADVHLAGGHTLGATTPKRDLIGPTIDLLTAVKSPDLSTSRNSTVPWCYSQLYGYL